jgi:DNA-binding response OmpR family regulator
VHILLLEDHGESRDIIAKLLVHCGHTVTVASNLAEASDLLGKMPFEVLLSDIGLPDGDAFQLVAEAKRSLPVMKTVALTGRATDEDRELSRQAGFDHFLTKPVDFHELRSLLGGEPGIPAKQRSEVGSQ